MSGRLANLYELNTSLDVGDAVRLFKDLSRDKYVDPSSPAFHWLLAKIEPKKLRSRQLTMLLHSCTGFLPHWIPDDTFLHHTCRAVQTQLYDFDSMGLTTVVWSHSKMNKSIPAFLLVPLMGKIEEILDTFNPQDCSNMLWGFARQTQDNGTFPPQTVRVAAAIVARASTMAFRVKSMEIANIFWSAGQLGLTSVAREKQHQLCSCVSRIASMLTPQHIAMILTGSSAIRLDLTAAQALYTQVQSSMSAFNPRCLSNALEGSLKTLDAKPIEGDSSVIDCMVQIVQQLLEASHQIIHEFDSRDITSLVSFLEHVQVNKDICDRFEVSEALKNSAKDRYIATCSEAQPIDLSRTLRSLVTVKVELQDQDITAVQNRLNATVGTMQCLDLCHMLWSHATGHWTLPRKLGRRVMGRCVEVIQEFTPQGIATVVWSLAKMYAGKLLPRFVEALETRCTVGLTWGAQEIANMLWSSATLQLSSLFEICIQYLSTNNEIVLQMNPTDVGNTMWALATVFGDDNDQKTKYKSIIVSIKRRLKEKALLLNMTPGQLCYTTWACSKLVVERGEKEEEEVGIIPNLKALAKAVGKTLKDMHAQNIGMLCWGLGVSASSSSSSLLSTEQQSIQYKLFKQIYSRSFDLVNDMNWQTIAHVEYYLRQHQYHMVERGQSMLEAMYERMSVLSTSMGEKNTAVENELEDKMVLVLNKEYENDGMLFEPHGILAVDVSIRAVNQLINNTYMLSPDTDDGKTKKKDRKMKQLQELEQQKTSPPTCVDTWNRFSSKQLLGDAWYNKEMTASVVVVRLNSYTASFEFILSKLASGMKTGNVLFIYGTESEGIGSIPSRLNQSDWCGVRVRGEVVRCVRADDGGGGGGGGGGGSILTVKSFRSKVKVMLPPVNGSQQKSHSWVVYPGLFSGGGMDIMTLYFLHVLAKEWWSCNAPTTTNPLTPLTVLDFCCGSGTICRTVTEWSKTTPNRSVLVDGCDADSLACLAATKNMKKSHGNNGNIYQSDGFQSIESTKQWDCILSNPPVHNLHGRSSFHVVEELTKGALDRLSDQGTLWLVTQNYIPVGCLCGPDVESGSWSACESFSDGRFTVWKLTKGVGNVGGKRKREDVKSEREEEMGESKPKKQKTGKKKGEDKKKKKKKKKKNNNNNNNNKEKNDKNEKKEKKKKKKKKKRERE